MCRVNIRTRLFKFILVIKKMNFKIPPYNLEIGTILWKWQSLFCPHFYTFKFILNIYSIRCYAILDVTYTFTRASSTQTYICCL